MSILCFWFEEDMMAQRQVFIDVYLHLKSLSRTTEKLIVAHLGYQCRNYQNPIGVTKELFRTSSANTAGSTYLSLRVRHQYLAGRGISL